MADVSVDPECKDPKELFGQGVRAYILQDYDSAVSALSKASELLVAQHNDDLHSSLGEVYLYYGKALLGLSRDQNEALGDAVPKNPTEDSDDDDEEEEQDEGIDAEESEENKTEQTSASSSLNGDSTKASNEKLDESGSTDPGPSSSKGQADEEISEDQQNGDEDASDLQLAWEVLELAKTIFQKQGDKKSLAETLIVLGEVSLESENFQSAITDIKQGLDVQKELYSKDSRAIAETLYKLGMAYSTNSQIDEAIESFNSSLEYLRNRIASLEEIKVMSQEHKDEVEDIKGLVPEIEDKIADMRVYKEEVCVCKEIVNCLKHKMNEEKQRRPLEPATIAVNRIEARRAPKIEAGIDKLTVADSKPE